MGVGVSKQTKAIRAQTQESNFNHKRKRKRTYKLIKKSQAIGLSKGVAAGMLTFVKLKPKCFSVSFSLSFVLFGLLVEESLFIFLCFFEFCVCKSMHANLFFIRMDKNNNNERFLIREIKTEKPLITISFSDDFDIAVLIFIFF